MLSDSATLVEAGGSLNWFNGDKILGSSTDVVSVKLVGSDGVKLSLGSKSHSTAKISAKPAKGYLRFGGRQYRGRLDFYPSRDGASLIVLNVLPLEEYLLGVVPSEMPSAWPEEALKAQAASRATASSLHTTFTMASPTRSTRALKPKTRARRRRSKPRPASC